MDTRERPKRNKGGRPRIDGTPAQDPDAPDYAPPASKTTKRLTPRPKPPIMRGPRNPKSRFADDVQRHIIEMVRKGNHPETAAASAGISRTTLNEWLRKGVAGDEVYAAFAAAVREAESESEAAAVRTLRSAGTWKAQAWFLERRFPQRWMKREGREITGPEGGPLELRQAMADDDEYRRGVLAAAIESGLVTGAVADVLRAAFDPVHPTDADPEAGALPQSPAEREA